MDSRGNISEVALGDSAIRLPLPITHYEVNGDPVRLRQIEDTPAHTAVGEIGDRADDLAFTAVDERTSQVANLSLTAGQPVCKFGRKYGRAFESSNFSFVPLNSATCIYNDHLTFADPSELHELLADADRLNFVPMVRLNYRKYGIDAELK